MAWSRSVQEQRSRPSNGGWIILGMFVGLVVALVVLVRRGIVHWDRRTATRYVNPLMLKFLAGRRYTPQAVVYHSGRKSGRSYMTPVAVMPYEDGFIIPLPYGADVDWCRNILAARGCSIRWHAKTYTGMKPELVDVQSIIDSLPPARRRIFRMLGVQQVLKVQIASITASGATVA